MESEKINYFCPKDKLVERMEDKKMLCACGNTKDKEAFKVCRECLFKSYKKSYDNCIDCSKEKTKPRDREFPRCYNCLQVYLSNR